MSHAVLSPSASGRWMQCPASIRMSRDLPPQEQSEYAREGTAFHTLAELSADYFLDNCSLQEYQQRFLDWALEAEDGWRKEQLGYLDDYLVFLQEAVDEEPDARVYLEVRVDTGVPGCWGTGDVIIVFRDRIKVIDIKYGAGMRVSAVGNSQLMLYGVGALSLVEDPLTIKEITVVIWQPRVNNISEYTIPRMELIKWRDDLIPTAKLALGEDAPFGPSEDACRWCPVAGECKARMKYMIERDFGNPDFMTGEEMAEAFSRGPDLKKWVDAVSDAALKRAYETAGSVPGFKVVKSGGRRSIKNAEKAIQILLDAGYSPDDVFTKKPATLGELDKLTGGGDKLQSLLRGLLVKSDGKLSLVADSDRRQEADANHSAENDFAEI